MERAEVSKGHYVCPNGCQPECDTPFFVSAGCVMGENEDDYELGILVYASGELSNRWQDGTVGIPDDVREMTQDHIDGGCPPHCIKCLEEANWVDNDENFCPKTADGKHVPNVQTLHIEYDGEDAYFDLNCKHCGRSGCAGKFDPAKIDW